MYKEKSIFIGQTVRVIQLLSNHSAEINSKLGRYGIIRGLKFTNTESIIIIVEFIEHTRIWFFKEELCPISIDH
uniref:Cytochrome b6-f complex subunit PetP n=1 Tax=Compsopogon caeruleus TaxID=31354 RepID=A0A1Z1XBD3_9RHOD|nr:hypothetical protein [Compsopogon caeruleus]ARX96107.1 hypothetical protein [Compsopogon caeruleus]